MIRFLRFLLLILPLLVTTGLATAAETSVVTAIRVSEGDAGDELSIEMDGSADVQMLVLTNPYRIALDFDDTLSAAKLPVIAKAHFLRGAKQGLVGPDRYRLLLELAGPVKPELEIADEAGRRLLKLTLAKGLDADFQVPASLSRRSARTVEAGEPRQDAPFVIVIDPGHGGVDVGATGENGTEEKAVNLAFGLALRDALKPYRHLEILMTREDDTFIPLNERSAIARRAGAGLFISLHADSIRYKDLRGATVYTLSEKASDSLAREVADGENAADRFAGPQWNQDAPEIHDILVDLVRQETEGFSEHFALNLVADLKSGGIRLINNPKRSAGFRVLRAPDVPSVLVELGYLSNTEEEELLTSPDWQKRVAGILARSVEAFSRHRSVVDQRIAN